MSRTALVAGVGPSLGHAVAVRLARQGCRVVAVGRSASHLEATCGAIRAEGGAAYPIVADLADPGWLAALADEEVGPVDIVVWVASAYAPFARIGATSIEDFDAVHATTLRGPFLLARAVVPGMCARGWGRFVVFGSAAASHGGAGQAAYASAKAGLVGLVRTLAAEGGPRGVTANLLELGFCDTERTGALDPDVRRTFLARSALGRAAHPAEVAEVAAFFAGEGSSFVTGAVLPVDGGLGIGLT